MPMYDCRPFSCHKRFTNRRQIWYIQTTRLRPLYNCSWPTYLLTQPSLLSALRIAFGLSRLRSFWSHIENGGVPTQLARCRFSGLTIFNAKIVIYFSNEIYRNNFTKQHSETVMVWNYQNADCSLRKKYSIVYYNFRHTFVPYAKGQVAAVLIAKGRTLLPPTE